MGPRELFYHISLQGLTSPLGLDQVQVQVFWGKDLQVQVKVQVLIQVLKNNLSLFNLIK